MSESNDYSKMTVGLRRVDDALINLGTYRKVSPSFGNKTFVLNAIAQHDYKTLREISNYFFESSGIYYNLCNYLAKFYRYDWYVTTYMVESDKASEKKVLKDFSNVLFYLDKSEVKQMCETVALDMIIEGIYYGIILDFGDKFSIQKLPPDYCRTRYTSGTLPVVELNLQFFDSYFANIQYRLKVLKMFPKEIQQAYVLFKEGKLKGDYPGDRSCWYPLEPGTSVCFSLNGKQFPTLVGVIPSIIDLDQAQELDRQKTMQQLLKIIVQKLPLDKNGDLIFDVDEAKDIHNNAVTMLKRAIGVDVLTTFADIEKIDTKDHNSNTTQDDLEKVERTVFNNAGITKNMFNADGNIATANSILTDAASIRSIPLQFESMLNRVIEKFNKKNYIFRLEILETTQYNYIELSKLYKEQTMIGFSKELPQIALGHSQSSILATATFENQVLHLAELMQPPQMSSTVSKNQDKSNQTNQNETQNKQNEQQENAGRPEKPDSEKSDKTIANRESS